MIEDTSISDKIKADFIRGNDLIEKRKDAVSEEGGRKFFYFWDALRVLYWRASKRVVEESEERESQTRADGV